MGARCEARGGALLVLYYLCCWPGSDRSDTSSERQESRRGTVGHDSGSQRHSSDFFSRRMASSAVSLHLPTTSGEAKEPLSAHRSHEEIGRRKSQQQEAREEPARHHSAPSVIDEVLHRRAWDLRVPLRPDHQLLSPHSGSPDAPRAEPESSSTEEHRPDEQLVARPCKKHYTNIKSSKPKKEREADDDKDCDATEASGFYIGDSTDNERSSCSITDSPRREDVHFQNKSIYKAKEAKQSFNESIRAKERPKRTLVPLEEHQPRMFGFCLDDVIDQLESLDRSGATHHTIESRISLSKPAFPPPSVEAVGYEGGACYLAGGEARACAAEPGGCAPRARHASDGDILAPPHRPESGAFSESDVDLAAAQEPAPPPRRQPRPAAAPARKETAI